MIFNNLPLETSLKFIPNIHSNVNPKNMFKLAHKSRFWTSSSKIETTLKFLNVERNSQITTYSSLQEWTLIQ
jgi:hypothetical protein